MKQHKTPLNKSLRSALAHKKLADKILNSIADSQVKWNAVMDKLNADDAVALDTNYSINSIAITFDSDGKGSEAQHKASFRKSLRSALAHRKLADEIVDALSSLQDSMRSSFAALDGGNVNGAHANFKVEELDPNA